MGNGDAGAAARAAVIEQTIEELLALRRDMEALAAAGLDSGAGGALRHRDSARNLLHYLALRRHDLRPLQGRLAQLGLSSLGRAEGHVLATVDAVLDALHRLAGRCWQPPADAPPPDFTAGQSALARHADHLLGPAPAGRGVRIMVTMPEDAADDYALVQALLQSGMNCMRLNCAHGDADGWLRTIEHLRRAERATGLPCRVIMDLAGPKLRTGPVAPGPAVLRARPQRDVFGRVTAPARVWLTPEEAPQPAPAAAVTLPLPGAWLAQRAAGEVLHCRDARGRERRLRLVAAGADGCWAELRRTAYFIPGTLLHVEAEHAPDRTAAVGALPALEGVIPLQRGDRLRVSRSLEPGLPARTDEQGNTLPAFIGCTLPEVLADVRPGEHLWLDDGRIGGLIEAVDAGGVDVRIVQAPAGGAKLRADKGINLPDSELHLAALTAEDLHNLDFVLKHADMVAMSFAGSRADVTALQAEMQRRGRELPLVLKIETRHGFHNLPDMLLAALGSPCCGVMIARGDLAVECGFERLAEIQEEILWVCEAGHVPVIWATQVLETLAKEGMPSRAEITDAAMGDRAECVMLNKGPHIVSAVRVLDDILRRMQDHQSKKSAMLRRLQLAQRFPLPRA